MAYSKLSGSTQSDLNRRLGPPPKPAPMGVPCLPLFVGHCVLGLGALLLLTSLGKAGEAIQAGLSVGQFPRIGDALLALVGALIVGALALLAGTRG